MTFLLGEGRLVGPRTVEVRLAPGGTRRFVADRLFLNLGTRATIPNIPGLVDAAPLTHVEALELGRLPAHLIVLGAGYVGVELAQAFRRFGSKVTMVGRGDQLLPREDPEVAAALRAIFEDEGIDVVLGAEPVAVEGTSGQRVRLRVQTASGRADDRGLRHPGRRRPHAEHPRDRARGSRDRARRATATSKVDDRLQTRRARGVGDGRMRRQPEVHARRVRRLPRRARQPRRQHRARRAAASFRTACSPTPSSRTSGSTRPTAQRDGVAVRVARLPMTSVLRAHAIGETRGFMKMLVDATSDRILGFTMLGAEAGEVVAVVQTAMLGGLPYTALRDAIFAHPTMAEGLDVLLASVPRRASPASGAAARAPAAASAASRRRAAESAARSARRRSPSAARRGA